MRIFRLTDQQRGPLIGIPSMVLFFISFGIGFKQIKNYNIAYFGRRCIELAFKLIASDGIIIRPFYRTDAFVHCLDCDKLCYNRIRIV